MRGREAIMKHPTIKRIKVSPRRDKVHVAVFGFGGRGQDLLLGHELGPAGAAADTLVKVLKRVPTRAGTPE